MNVKIKLLSPRASVPAYQSELAAGADLCAAVDEAVTIGPGQTVRIPTGIAVECEDSGVVILLFARSGLASKHGIALANGVGVVDADYRGEIQCALHNHSAEPYTIRPGERIAQMAFLPVLRADFIPSDELSGTERGSGGFGHTGK